MIYQEILSFKLCCVIIEEIEELDFYLTLTFTWGSITGIKYNRN